MDRLYILIVHALDNDNTMREEAEITINVEDENDNSPVFSTASQSIYCDENLGMGQTCGKVIAIDADQGNAGDVEYKLPGAQETWYRNDGSIENRNLGLFEIDAVTGEVRLTKSGKQTDFDREKYTKVEIVVTANDAPGKMANTGLVEQKVEIYLNDVNDNAVRVVEYPGQGI